MNSQPDNEAPIKSGKRFFDWTFRRKEAFVSAQEKSSCRTATWFWALIGEIRSQLAHGIANAADVCAAEGQIDRALMLSLHIEELIHSADQLLQAAATLNRSSKEGITKE